MSSCFDLGGEYFASCVLGVDGHRVRVQNSGSSLQSSVSTNYGIDKNLQVLSMSWGLFPHWSDLKLESQYLAICVSDGSIYIYSPVQDEVIGTLKNGTNAAILSYHFSRLTNTGFSVDSNGAITEWDISDYKLIRTFKIPQLSASNNEQINQLITVMYDNRVHLLIASYSIALVSLDDLSVVKFTFPGHVSPIHTIKSISDDLFLTAAANDRFVNVYSLSKQNIEKVLVSQANVSSVTHGEHNLKKIIITVTESNVEVFNDPLLVSQDLPNAANKFAKRKKIKSKSKNSDAIVSISRPADENPTNETLTINSACVLESKLILTWLENSLIPFFDTTNWIDSDEYKIVGTVNLQKSKPLVKVNDHSLHGVDLAATKQYNEGNAIIQAGDNFQDLETGDDNEPSLAEQLTKLPESATLTQQNEKKKATTGSLSTILTQAIKSNDHTLLETVLNNKSEDVIKNTIKKLSTLFVIPLLNRISERIARNSNKQSLYNVWIKWLFIIHGGYLSNYPDLAQNVGILHTTLHRRSLTLGRLLELNGKIDMVLENMELKKLIMKSNTNDEYLDEDTLHESDVEYIEELEDNGFEFSEESDIDMDLVDDYQESSDEEDLEQMVTEESEEEDNYSDEEVDTKMVK